MRRPNLEKKFPRSSRILLQNKKFEVEPQLSQLTELFDGSKDRTQEKKIRPQDDFDAYVNGAWARKTNIPRDHSSWGPWEELEKKIKSQIMEIFDDLESNIVVVHRDHVNNVNSVNGNEGVKKGVNNVTTVNKTSEFKRRIPNHAENLLRVFWQSGLALDSPNDVLYKKAFTKCAMTLRDLLQTVNSSKSLGKICGELLKYDIGPVNFAQIQDQENPDMILANLLADGLGLSDPSYYLDKSEQMREMRHGYLDMINQTNHWIPLDPERVLEANGIDVSEAVLYLETKLAQCWPSREVLRQNSETYNKLKVSHLKKKYSSDPSKTEKTSDTSKVRSGWSWDDWLSSSEFEQQLKDDTYVVVQNLEYFERLSELAVKVDKYIWHAYLRFSIIRRFGLLIKPMISHDVLNILITGQQDVQPHKERILSYINDSLGDVLGSLYVQRYFSPNRKAGVMEMIQSLKQAFKHRIVKLDWMEQETKDMAIYKLEKLRPLIGYPEEFPDYEDTPERPLLEDNFLHNYMYCLEYNYGRWRESIGKPPEEGTWAMHPHTLNAYCDFEKNEIVFPAAILQAPFYDENGSIASNYGGIGAVIGHEITHAFDDEGSKFDAHGRTVNWWTERDRREFEARTEKIIRQYDGIRMAGVAVNGELTQGENIADLGGLLTSYDAMMNIFKKSNSDSRDGNTKCHNDRDSDSLSNNLMYEKQQFFTSWALVWREVITEEALRDGILRDCHAPHKLRINVPLSNMPEFYEAFHVKKGDKLYREEKDRVRIW